MPCFVGGIRWQGAEIKEQREKSRGKGKGREAGDYEL